MDRTDEVGPEASDRPTDRVHRARISGLRIFLIAFAVFFGAGAVWSMATPLLAAPDEPSQIVKAASLVRGVWTARCYVPLHGDCAPGVATALGFEALPTFYDLLRAPAAVPAHGEVCFKSKAEGVGVIPASSAQTLNRPPTTSQLAGGYLLYTNSYQARYPPLYYAVVGLPSYLGNSTAEIYLMRLVSAALGAIFLALALTAALVYSGNRVIVAGIVVAATPMVLFLDGVVNPSGLEISSAIAAWTAGSILVTERLADPPPGLLAILGVSAAVLESTRALSPFWLALTVVALVAVAPWPTLRSALGRRSTQIVVVAVAFVGVLAIWWTTAVHATYLFTGGNTGVPANVSTTSIFANALERNRFYVPDMVGVFGWFDTYSPPFTLVAWYVMVAALVVIAALRSLRRGLLLGAMAVATAVIPALIVTTHAHAYGYTWSGRDTLPFAVGLPVLAAATLGTSKRPLPAAVLRRAVPAVIILAAVAQFLAFYESVRRYTVGTNGPIFGFLSHPSWQPAISNIGAIVAEGGVLIALSAIYWWSARRLDDSVGVPDAAPDAGPVTADQVDRSSVSGGTTGGGT